MIQRDAYDEQLRAINEVELDLEILIQEITTSSFIFSSPQPLTNAIESMKDYLRDLVRQYAKKYGEFNGQPPTLSLAQLDPEKDKITDFVGSSDNSNFDALFVDKYYSALEIVRTDVFRGITAGEQIVAAEPSQPRNEAATGG